MLIADVFKARLEELVTLPLVDCPHESYNGYEVSDSEGFAVVYVDSKERYRDPAHFLVNSLRLRCKTTLSFDDFQNYLFKPLLTQEFSEMMDFLPFWTFRPRRLTPNDEATRVVLLEDEWNNQSTLAEYPRHFLYVLWGTGG